MKSEIWIRNQIYYFNQEANKPESRQTILSSYDFTLQDWYKTAAIALLGVIEEDGHMPDRLVKKEDEVFVDATQDSTWNRLRKCVLI